MFLFFFRGDERGYGELETLLERHATWLGLRADAKRYPLPGETVGAFVRLRSPGTPVRQPHREDARRVVVSTAFPARKAREDSATGFDPRDTGTDTPVRLRLDLGSGELAVEVPLIGAEPAYYTADSRGLVVATDLRPLLRWAGGEPDPVAVAALLQYGTIPPPHTWSVGVRRVPCGHRLTSVPGAEPDVRRAVPPISEWVRPAEPGDAADETARLLDGALARVPQRSVLFFSGGTDSGLMAARLVTLGRRDVRLVNYSFGPQDEDSVHAERMAARLELPFRRVTWDPDRIVPACARIGLDFAVPFNDLSVIPTHLMLLAAAEDLGDAPAALLGVGADDVYEGGLKIRDWSRLLAAPRPLRRAVVGTLGPLRPWWDDGALHRVWGIGRRSLLARHELGPLVMHNDLAGIGYPRDDALQGAIEDAWRGSIDAFSTGLAAEDRLSLMYLMNGGMGWEAPKFDPLRRMGVQAFYPFLEGPLLRHGLSLSWEQKCAGRKDKVLLKRLLSRSVPSEMVERPKRGFSPPFRELLSIDAVHDLVRETLLGASGPLDGAYDTRFVTEALDRGRRGDRLNRSVMNLLWVLFFTSCWLEQVDRAPA